MEKERPWLGPAIVLFFLLLYTITAGTVFCYNALIIFIQKDFDQPLTLLEWCGTLPASIPMLAAPAAMALNFKIGTWATVLLGVVLASLGLCLSCLAQNVGLLFFTYGTMGTIGVTLLINPPAFLIDQVFPYEHPRHVLATSISACGFPLAALVVVPTADQLAGSIGWKLTYLVMGIVLLIGGAPTVITARLWAKQNPTTNYCTNFSGRSDADTLPYSSRRRVLTFALWFTASVTKCFGYYTPMLTLVKHMDSIGIPEGIAWRVIPVIGASELVSRLSASYFGDKIKGKTLIMYICCCLFLSFINIFGPLFTRDVHFMIYGLGLGLFGGPIIAALYSCSSEVLNGHEVPLLFSIFRSGLGAASMVGPLIAGAVYDLLGTFKPMFYCYTVVYLLTAILYAVIIAVNRWRPIDTLQSRAKLIQNITQLDYQTLGDNVTGIENEN